MNFDYTRPGGVWSSLTGLTAAEMADIDAKTVDSLSGTGGTYALVDDMIIGGDPGASWEFDVPLVCNYLVEAQSLRVFGDAAQFLGGIVDYGELTVLGPAVFSALSTFNDSTVFNDTTAFNATATFEYPVICNGEVFLYGNANFYDSANFNGAYFGEVVSFAQGFNVVGEASFVNPSVFKGGAEVWGSLAFSHDGRIESARIVKRQLTGSASNASYGPQQTDHVIGPFPLLSELAYTIDDSSAADGDRMRFSNQSSAHAIQIKSPGGTILASIQQTTGTATWCDVERVAGQWIAYRGGTL